MKLKTITQPITESKSTKGTYAAVRYDNDSKKRVEKFAETNNIPNALRSNSYHTTLLYSRKHCPEYEAPESLDTPYVCVPLELDTWNTQNGKRALVLRLDCPALVARHKQLMKEHKATYDFDEYLPHITLSYDIGDVDVGDLDVSTIGNLKANEEYGEDLDLDWTDKNAK